MTSHMASDGKDVSLLGYGAMRLPTVDGGHANGWAKGASKADIDQARLDRQVAYMLKHGVNYFDTSPAYCRGESESALGTALAASGYDRGSYFIATKLSNFSPSQHPIEACRKMFEKSLKSLRTSYIDFYLLHAIGNGGFAAFEKRYLKNGALDWCCELREQKRIRKLGFSFHGDPRAFEWCVENHGKYKWDFCQIQMNYVDWRHAKEVNSRNLDAKYLYETLTAKGIPVVVMEPLLGGRLAASNRALSNELSPLDPKATLAKWAFRFCASFDNVATILSGMTYDEQIKENIETFSPVKRCSAAEFAALERAALAMLNLKAVPCNMCNYCMPCPYGLDIPAILAFRNRIVVGEKRLSAAEVLRLYREAVPEELRRADHCTGCGECISHCPQSIDIVAEMDSIDKWIDTLKTEAAR